MQDDPDIAGALGAGVTVTGTVTLAEIDTAVPNPTMAEMMMYRLMRMTPPWLLPRSAARCMAPATRTAHLNNVAYCRSTAIQFTLMVIHRIQILKYKLFYR